VPLRAIKGRNVSSSLDLSFDKLELESKFNRRTKMILVNNPNNPTGKVIKLNYMTIYFLESFKQDH